MDMDDNLLTTVDCFSPCGSLHSIALASSQCSIWDLCTYTARDRKGKFSVFDGLSLKPRKASFVLCSFGYIVTSLLRPKGEGLDPLLHGGNGK